MDTPPDAATIVGLLANDDRRLVAAALMLGDASLDAICARTDLSVAAAASALARLVSGGLVERGSDGAVHLLGAAFAHAARDAAQAKPPSESHEGPPEIVKVLNIYVRDGRLTQIPTVRSKRLIVLDHLVQEFEPGRRYSEPMVNLLLGKWHADTAALRRYMVDEGMLDRENSQYWRAGGSVPVGRDKASTR
jgi:hypothetical protein